MLFFRLRRYSPRHKKSHNSNLSFFFSDRRRRYFHLRSAYRLVSVSAQSCKTNRPNNAYNNKQRREKMAVSRLLPISSHRHPEWPQIDQLQPWRSVRVACRFSFSSMTAFQSERRAKTKNFPDIMHTIENLRSVYWNSIGAPAMMMPTTGYAFTESLVNTFSFSGCHGRFLSCTVIIFWETRGKQSRPIV